MLPIKTARLQIRRFTRADIEPFVRFMADRESMAMLPFSDEQKRPEGSKRLVEETIASYDGEHPMLAFAVEAQASREFVGFCGLTPHDDKTTEIMYAVIPSARRQGYATEIAIALIDYAFNTLGYHRVIAFILPINEYSKIVAAKAGFKEGSLVSNANFLEKVHQFLALLHK